MPKTNMRRPAPPDAVDAEKYRRDTAELERRLEEAEKSLSAIRNGEVDALVISGPNGDQVYTLRDSDRPYRMVVENMRDGVVTLRDDGLILYVNRQFAAILGVGLSSVLGTDLHEYATPSGRESLDALIEAGLKAGARATVELADRKGRPVLVHLSLAAMAIDGPRVLSGVAADVTEERRAGEVRARLAATVDNSPDGIMVLNPAEELVYANPACRTITGYSVEDLLGMAGSRLGGAAVSGIRAGLEAEGSWKGHVTAVRKDGSPLELDVSAALVKTPGGGIANYIVFFRDITEALRLEQKVRQMERTEALGRLAGGVAHDLNNILQPILLNAQMLLGDAKPGTPEHKMLKNLLQAAHRQKDLVKKILSFARRSQPVLKRVRFGLIVAESVNLLRPSLPPSIVLRLLADAESDAVMGDATELHELAINLCTNAADSMESGGTVTISLARTVFGAEDPVLNLKPGPYVKLTVSDTGCGIPPRDLGKIFDPFFTTKEPGRGTGIGLPVVRGIVMNHGGSISVESKIGQGTTVTVFLPAAGEATDPARGRKSSSASGKSKRRILIVDDESLVLETMRQAMSTLGHEPVAFRDGAEALAVFRTDPDHFDLAVVDQTMPGMSGLELASELARIRPGLPLILATGYSKAVDERAMLEAGVKELVMKPMSLEELTAVLRRALLD